MSAKQDGKTIMATKTLFALISAFAFAAPTAGFATASLTGEKIGEVYATPDTIEVRIGREFPAFDTDFSGELDHYEFSKWLNPLIDLRLKYDEVSAERNDIDAFIDSSFKKADSDENGEVSQNELSVFFGAEVE